MNTDRNQNGTFRPRCYGLTELAQLYRPDVTAGAARRALLKEIDYNPRLRAALGRDGGRWQRRPQGRRPVLTPRQVAAIVEELGEP